MKKTQGWVTLVLLALALVAPAATFARSKTTKTQHAEVPKDVQKSSKQYDKQLKKDQKRQSKLAKKQTKENKKRRAAHSVTG